MVEGGPIDFLTGDYLAELTMALLWRTRERGGYARTFLIQMEEVLGLCLDRGVRVVANAGGLDPVGLAGAVEKLTGRMGLEAKVAAVSGDDLMGRLSEIDLEPWPGTTVTTRAPVTANAYLGCWGIVSALDRGAQVVITGRVTDAALVMGPAAHHFGWERHDRDPLAGALVAGHVIECGAQATGGNYSFFDEVPGNDHVGFPLVEMHSDGSFVVTKHPGTGGLVSVETVTAQLLYEIGGHRYLSPDVTARFDTIRLRQDGRDRVEVSGVAGEPPPPTLKVALNELGGYRNEVTFVLTGLDIEAKARLAEATLWKSLGGRSQVSEATVQLIRGGDTDAVRNEEAMAHLRVTVKDDDPDNVGRRFSGAAVEGALSGYPGFFLTGPPENAVPFAVYRPALIDASLTPALVRMGEETWEVSSVIPATGAVEADRHPELASSHRPAMKPTVRLPLGRAAGARSGDKGGDANVGVWVRTPDAFGWLRDLLTVDGFKALVPETDDLVVERHLFPNLSAINFVVRGLLGDGVAASTRTDPQAKSLGEFLRSRPVDIPRWIVEGGSTIPPLR